MHMIPELDKRKLALAIAVAIGGAGVQPLRAQPSEDQLQGLEEVIVTARRVQENVQKAPVTVSAVSGDLIEQALITNVTEIDALAPNVNITSVNFFGGAISPFIRGVGTFEQEGAFDPAVAVLVDGIYLSTTVGAVPDLFDIERVEVLRGPQGTVFGRNSLSGALYIVTKRPAEEFGLKIAATYGEFGQREYAARVDFPITDGFAGKVSVQSVESDGFYDRTLVTDTTSANAVANAIVPGSIVLGNLPDESGTGDAGGADNISVRPTLTWKPDETAEISLIAEYSKNETEPASVNVAPARIQTLPDGTPVPAFNPAAGLLPFTYAISASPVFGGFGQVGKDPANLRGNVFDIIANVDNEYELEITGASLEGIFDLGDGELTVNTGIRETEQYINFDTDGSGVDLFNVERLTEIQQFTFEARYNGDLDALGTGSQYIVGVFYLDDEYDQKDHFYGTGIVQQTVGLGITTAGLGIPGPATPVALYDIYGGSGQKRESLAVYATLDYVINEDWRATFGARYSQEDKEFAFAEGGSCQNFNFSLSDCGLAPGTLPPARVSDDWNNFSSKVTLDYQIGDDVLVYGIVAQAFRSGGFNGRAPVRTLLGPFEPEEVTSYELGLKTELFDNRLRLNAAAFLNDYKDLQREFQVGPGLTTVTNAAEGSIKGLEFELTALPFGSIPELTLRGTLGLLDTEYDSYAGDLNGDGVPEDLSSTEFPRASGITASVDLSYAKEIANGELSSRLAYSWQDESFPSFQNFDSFKTEAYGLLDFSVGCRMNLKGGSSAGVTLFGKNLTDERVIVNGSVLVGLQNIGDVNPPRRYGIRVDYEY